MHEASVEVISEIRAAFAALFPAGAEHEMVDDQLAAACEQLVERLFARWSVEHVALVDLDPRKFAALAAEFIAPMSELLLFCKKRFARLNPFFLRDHVVACFNGSHSFVSFGL